MYPTIACLCPTYGRPKLLANAIECFLRQRYPIGRAILIVLDDLGTIAETVTASQFGMPPYRIYSTPERYKSLPEKYNNLWMIAPKSDIYIVWEDDDCQLPWCLMSHARALEHASWSQPSVVWSDFPGDLIQEGSLGRFHGSLAIRGSTLTRIGGWPLTRRPDFDQQLMGLLRDQSEPGDPLEFCPPCPSRLAKLDTRCSPYIFRWHTKDTHGQNTMQGPNDEGWYDRYEPSDRSGPHTIIPALDEDSRRFYEILDATQKV